MAGLADAPLQNGTGVPGGGGPQFWLAPNSHIL
jgi:hypothetical protein